MFDLINAANMEDIEINIYSLKKIKKKEKQVEKRRRDTAIANTTPFFIGEKINGAHVYLLHYICYLLRGDGKRYVRHVHCMLRSIEMSDWPFVTSKVYVRNFDELIVSVLEVLANFSKTSKSWLELVWLS